MKCTIHDIRTSDNPICGEWLRAIGFQYSEQSTCWRYGPLRVMFVEDDVVVFVSGYCIPKPARPRSWGGLRHLIDVLGLPLIDETKPSNYAQPNVARGDRSRRPR